MRRVAPDFHTKIEKDIAQAMMWRAVLGFGEPSTSRRQLLTEFEAIATNYPDSEYQQRAKDTVGILTRMVAEDAAHANHYTSHANRAHGVNTAFFASMVALERAGAREGLSAPE